MIASYRGQQNGKHISSQLSQYTGNKFNVLLVMSLDDGITMLQTAILSLVSGIHEMEEYS